VVLLLEEARKWLVRRGAGASSIEFECRICKKIFTLVMRISDRLAARIKCPGCGSEDVETLMQPFIARTAKKS
jgi:putative FmdB family regulatory protein